MNTMEKVRETEKPELVLARLLEAQSASLERRLERLEVQLEHLNDWMRVMSTARL